MEVCRKLPVSECTEDDWFVDLRDGNERTAENAGSPYVPPDPNPATPSFQAGSTVDPPLPALQRFPRRVAFRRNAANDLLSTDNPQPLGITDGVGTIEAGRVGRLKDNALWFAANDGGGNVAYTANATDLPFLVNTSDTLVGTTDGSKVPVPILAVPTGGAQTVLPPPAITVPPDLNTYRYEGSQPLLVPVPQIVDSGATGAQQTRWIIQPGNNGNTFNLLVGAGDTPSRALNNSLGDFNGGLQNLPRFLEIWSDSATGTSIVNNIKGSFIQQNRSTFSTAPYLPILPKDFLNAANKLVTLFTRSPDPVTAPARFSASQLPLEDTYPIQGFRIPYFTPPTRNWGFDVGLLSQPPDLFTQRFTTPSTRTQPAEYFREVSRTDPWVKTLMCGTVADLQPNADKKATSLGDNC
jgi:hypothetical protein